MTEPTHVTETVAALRSAGWITPLEAVDRTGHTLADIASWVDSDRIEHLQIGRWWEGPIQCTVHLVRSAELDQIPIRPHLSVIDGGQVAS